MRALQGRMLVSCFTVLPCGVSAGSATYTAVMSTGPLPKWLLSCMRSVVPPIDTWMICRAARLERLALGMSLGPVNSGAGAHVPSHRWSARRGVVTNNNKVTILKKSLLIMDFGSERKASPPTPLPRRGGVISFKGRKAQIKLKNSSLTPLAPSPRERGSD